MPLLTRLVLAEISLLSCAQSSLHACLYQHSGKMCWLTVIRALCRSYLLFTRQLTDLGAVPMQWQVH
jgi:hypothetical protein